MMRRGAEFLYCMFLFEQMQGVYFVIGGFQKCASTWLHHCLAQNARIYMPRQHMLHYFDIHYHRGAAWYRSYFSDAQAGQLLGDATVTYARCPAALRRINCDFPAAKLILILRDPIDRAWSHYWHERKKGKMSFLFDEWKSNFDLYEDWIAPGLYDQHLENCFSVFGDERVKVLFFDDIKEQPSSVLRDVFDYLGLDCEDVPGGSARQVNRTVVPARWRPSAIVQWVRGVPSERRVHSEGVSATSRDELREVYQPTVDYLQNRFNRDLSHWLNDQNAVSGSTRPGAP